MSFSSFGNITGSTQEKTLSAAQRKSLPKSSFGVPSKAKTASGKAKPGSFPLPAGDKKRARAALSLIRYAPPNRRAAIKKKAKAILAKDKNKKK